MHRGFREKAITLLLILIHRGRSFVRRGGLRMTETICFSILPRHRQTLFRRMQQKRQRRRDKQRRSQSGETVSESAEALCHISHHHRTVVAAEIAEGVDKPHGRRNALGSKRLRRQSPKWAERSVDRRRPDRDRYK